ncbi:MAG: hydrogenase maturation nickel metallochaperone HypA [Deltaproteobacteria bacterium]|nr:hydrogenase maturation nickel metallochaperone HypA [Deltaproteobacteria bacterium]
MHEMSIAQSMLEIVFEEAAKNGLAQVTRIGITVGKMSAVVPASLQFCFEILTKDSTPEGAVLASEALPVRCRCRTCGQTFDSDGFFFACPACQGNDVELVSGQELYIKEIEGE